MTHYAGVYCVYGSRNVSLDEDLSEIVDELEAMEDNGDCSTRGYWKMVDGTWVSADDEAAVLIKARSEAQSEMWDRQRERAKEKPWRLYLLGPDDTKEWQAAYVTEAEARESAARKEAEGWATEVKLQK